MVVSGIARAVPLISCGPRALVLRKPQESDGLGLNDCVVPHVRGAFGR
jgi:hypothetical protein